MTDRVKGTLAGVGLSLLAVILWIILSLIGFIAGLVGVLMGICVLWAYKRICPQDDSNYRYIAAVIVIVLDIILAEILTVALLASSYGVSLSDLLSYSEVQGAIIFDVIMGYVFSFIAFGAYVFSEKRKAKMAAMQMRVNAPSGWQTAPQEGAQPQTEAAEAQSEPARLFADETAAADGQQEDK